MTFKSYKSHCNVRFFSGYGLRSLGIDYEKGTRGLFYCGMWSSFFDQVCGYYRGYRQNKNQ